MDQALNSADITNTHHSAKKSITSTDLDKGLCLWVELSAGFRFKDLNSNLDGTYFWLSPSQT